MKNIVVVGSQCGDEGKGKIVDWLSDQADVVVRFQGGHNAGHTLVISFFFKIFIALLLINRAPPFAIITGSKIILETLIIFSELITDLITLSEWSMPILIASGFISLQVNSICLDISFGSIPTIDLTPVVFCEVTAVIAVIA